jgi:hypothetical protein
VNRTEVKLDGIWGGVAILPGEVLLFWLQEFPEGAIKRIREGRNPDWERDRGWQICV